MFLRIKIKKIISLFIVILLSLLIVSGCGNRASDLSPLLGSWFLTERSFIFLLTFRANGSFTLSKRKVGPNSKVIGKKKDAVGEWEVAEKQLMLRILKADDIEGWMINTTLFFEILLVNSDLLELKPSNRIGERWKKVKSGRNLDEQDAASGKLNMLKPIILNLAKEKRFDKEMYLCVLMGLFLDDVNEDGAEEETKENTKKEDEFVAPTIHPRIRDTILFYLSAQTHKDLATFEKVNKVKRDLFKVLKPYFYGDLNGIKIDNIVITSKWEIVEEFITEFIDTEKVTPVKKSEKDIKEKDIKE